MKGNFLKNSYKPFIEHNIFADKSALVLQWLLLDGINKDNFSIREVTRDSGVSLGLVQKVFEALTMNGCLNVQGVRTAKKFSLKRPDLLLKNWLESYSIVKKCKMRTYRTGFRDRAQLLKALQNFKHCDKVVLALHSAAAAHGYKNSNLETLELYVMDSNIRSQLEAHLQLEPQERGYEVLLIEPYYKAILNQDTTLEEKKTRDVLKSSSILLIFLDLYHFPLRGREQADFLAERSEILKRIYKKGK